MKYAIKLFLLYLSFHMTTSCQKNKVVENQFSSQADTIFIKTKKVKGPGLFMLGYGFLQFKDTSDTFLNPVIYPKHIENIKRIQLKVDHKETKNHHIELLSGYKDGSSIFIVDQNNNKDLTDDSMIKSEKISWTSPNKIVKCEYLISNGREIIKDSSWLSIGTSNGLIALGRREHIIGSFSIDNKDYEVGVFEPRNPMSFTYSFLPKIALLSNSGVKKDSLAYSDLLELQEVLNFNGEHYRFESVSNNGDQITIVKDLGFKTKTGTQKGMIAPDFMVVTISGDTIRSSALNNKLTIIANSCGCGGDIESTEAFYEMEKLFGKTTHVLRVDSNIKESDIGIHIDSEVEFNRDFYNNYRKEYCSRICYVIGKNKRIIDKFYITDWRDAMKKIIE